MKTKLILVISALFLACHLVGCKSETPKTTSAPGTGKPMVAEPATPGGMGAQGGPAGAGDQGASPFPDTGKIIKGKVLESQDAGGYSYLKLNSNGEEMWVALPKANVAVGEEVSVVYSMEMQNFESKALGKTFDKVIFASGMAGAAPGGAAGAQGAKPDAAVASKADSFSAAVKSEGAAGGAGASPMSGTPPTGGGSSSAVAPFSEVKVEKAEGENGLTVGDVFSKRNDFNGKSVKVRGKVVKVSQGIMGTNWIHLQDGTGNPMENTHDLVVTSPSVPEKESIITVSGNLVVDKDFGAGYKYSVIIENAEVAQ